MFRFAAVFAAALTRGMDIMDIMEDNDAISLLQIAAHHHRHEKAQAPVCQFHGDTHGPQDERGHNKNYYGQRKPDPQAYGVFQVTESADKKVSVQAFQCASIAAGDVGWITMVAYNLDGTTIEVTGPNWHQLNVGPYDWSPIRKQDGDGIENGDDACCGIRMQIKVNGQQYSITDLPLDIEGTNIRLEGEYGRFKDILKITAPGLGDFQTSMHGSSAGHGDSQPFMYMDTKTTLASDAMVPPAEANTWCTKGAEAVALDKDGDWSTSLFSVAAHHNVCDYCNGWNQNMNQNVWECVPPPPLPPHPEAREMCETNGCSFTHGEQMCASLKDDEKLFGDCVTDFCVTCKDIVAVDAVEEQAGNDPKPICAQGSVACNPAEVCNSAVKMNTLKVSQNNLGGAGPDAGAEEIRYSKAAIIDGQTVDLVVTADGPYNCAKASRNGNNEGGFGIMNLKCGTSTTVMFNIVDSATGAPVTVDNIAITWYDIDEGKKTKGRESVTVCGTSGAMVSDATTLTMSAVGDCHTATSSVEGTGKDNPSTPFSLTSAHLARSATFPLSGVSEFSSTLTLTKGFKGRNFMFAIEPTVACS